MDEQTPAESSEHHPPLREQFAAFYGYTPFPPLMTLYADFSGLTTPFRTLRLCTGTNKADLLYVVDIHYGYTPRGPLNFRPGLYLRNGPTANAPILAGAGDETRLPVLLQTFSLKSAILMPPVDPEEARNPRDVVEEIMRASTRSTTAAVTGIKTHHATFRFAIEVGVKMWEREEFEWVDVSKNALPATVQDPGPSTSASAAAENDTAAPKGTRFVLLRCPHQVSPLASESSLVKTAHEDEIGIHHGQSEILAELVFTNVMSWNRLFTLEFKGAGLTGEMGDRWALMVVMTALRVYWLRSNGKAGKGVVKVGEMVRGI